MNHPGILFSILLIVLMAGLPSLVRWKNRQDTVAACGYVCPPCGCSGHAVVYQLPGACEYCRMPLIRRDHPRIAGLDKLFRSEHQFDIYHHKVFYPAYFLAIFLGLFTLWQYRSSRGMLWFLFFYLSYVVYSYKSHLSGTGYSMRAPPRWFFFPGSFLLVAGPALWLYSKSYGARVLTMTRGALLHFLPALLVVLLHTFYFLGSQELREGAQFNSFDHYPGLAEQLVFLCSGMYYLFLSIRLLQRRGLEEKDVKAWFYFLFGLQAWLIFIWMVLLAVNFYFYNWMATGLDYHPIWMSVALFSLIGAYMIIFRKDLLDPKPPSREHRLSQAALPQLKERLEQLMSGERPYLKPDLTLHQLAEQLEMKEKDLSELLNAGLETTFYRYVNGYRLEAVKKMLLDPEKQHLTNFAIAQEAGFPSRSTFFTIFKKETGMTPGAFKKANL